jgi:hypothetical protein
MVAVEAGDQQPTLAHPAEGLFQSHHTAEIRRTPHRTTQVGPQRRTGHAGCHIGAAATGATRDVVEMPGIVHGAVVEIIGGRSRRKLLQVFLADNDGTRLFAPPDYVGVLCRDMVRQDLGTDSAADARRGNVVLDANGDAMRGPRYSPRIRAASCSPA